MASKGLRETAERAKNELRETGRDLRRSRVIVGLCQWGIRFLLGATLATGEIFDGAAPFGLAFVGASGAGNEGFAAMVGAMAGYLLSRGLEDGLRYAAGCILVFATAFAFYDLSLCKRPWFMPLTTGVFNAVTGLVTLAPRPWTTALAARFAAEAALTAVGTYAFHRAFSLWRDEEAEDRQPGLGQRLGLLGLALALLLSLARLRLLGGLSVGRICAALLALCAGSAAGPGAGAAVGLAVGLFLFLTGWRFPGPVSKAIGYVSDLNTPLAMMVVGAQMARADLKSTFTRPILYGSALYKLAAAPAIVLLVLLPLKVDPILFCACVILNATPTAGVTGMLAQTYGRDTVVSAQTVTLSTLLSILTLPVFATLARTLTGI